MNIPASVIINGINKCQRVNINDIIDEEIDKAISSGIDELQRIVEPIEKKYDIWISIECKWSPNPGSDIE